MRAAENGRKEIVELLVKAGADLEIQDAYDYTALMWAAAKGHKDIVKLLKDAAFTSLAQKRQCLLTTNQGRGFLFCSVLLLILIFRISIIA